jgi:DNA-binding winged helix-turn-helix (wHTH) protein
VSSSIGDCVVFGPFRLFAAARVLERDGVRQEVGSRALDILIALIERAGEIVTHRELIARAWRGLVVDNGNLRVQVTHLRRVLEDGNPGSRYVANVPGQGYSFVAPFTGAEARVPGLGKTTVAVSAAHCTLRKFTNGVCHVDLGCVKDPAHVVNAVAAAVGIPPDAKDPLRALRHFLHITGLLLVLDNCEHVAESAAAFAESIFSAEAWSDVHVRAPVHVPTIPSRESRP